MRRFLTVMTVVLAGGLLTACDGDDGSTEPSVLSIAGNWRGSWQSSIVTLTLQQAGTSVTGSLNDSQEVFNLTGEVDEFGVFRFVSTTTTPGGCTTFNSSGPNHVLLSGMGTMMNGAAAHRSRTDCADPRSRTAVQTGSLVAEKTST